MLTVTYEQWQGALSTEAASGVFGFFQGAKNRNTCIDMVRWYMATGLIWRTKDGIHIVRGSVKGRADGLKEDKFLQGLGITAAKIRGFIRTALARGVLEILSAPPKLNRIGKLFRTNYKGEFRNPPVVYRFSAAFLATVRKGQSKKDGTKVAVSPLGNPSSGSTHVAPKAQVSPGGLGFRGYLAPQPSAAAPAPTLSGRLAGAFGRLGRAVLGRAPKPLLRLLRRRKRPSRRMRRGSPP